MNAKAKIQELVTEFNNLVDEITERQQRQMEIKGAVEALNALIEEEAAIVNTLIEEKAVVEAADEDS